MSTPKGTASLTGFSLQYAESSEGLSNDANQMLSISCISRLACSLQQQDISLDDTAHQEGYSATESLPLLVEVSGLQGTSYNRG